MTHGGQGERTDVGGRPAELRRRRRDEVASLADECTAFLDGRYVELLQAAGSPIPVWAWMNLLAHGTDAEIREAAARLPDVEGWERARSFVAAELVDAVDASDTSMDDVQREVLVPLELDVLQCCSSDTWTAGQLVLGLLRVLPGTDRHLPR